MENFFWKSKITTKVIYPGWFRAWFSDAHPRCEMLYFHTADYNADAEGALNACDPRLAINWPKPITERSERDKSHAMLTDDFCGMDL
jgi:dTDP-4-dehydrorhamnose 3,5-epimerase